MSNESELRRLRSESERHRVNTAKASGIMATQRKKAAEATIAAGKSKNASTVKNKLAEAQRATKAANDAEKKRADSEKKLADVERKINATQQKYEKEQRDTQVKALAQLRRDNERATSQFHPPARLGSPISPTGTSTPTSDVFLSHASEDKDEIARPLKDSLEAKGISVWFDEINIKLGQSIRQEIELGIASCRFGVVIVSPDFFKKQWTQAELDALFGRKMNSGENLILPVWHRVSKDEVLKHSPLLAGILALNSSLHTVDEMADQIADVIQTA
ncbi:TIR domain-containing protein [Citricoccus sp. NPDC079358]|uniref:toll/interleukin-1 receptor domain-containing protein n=1 Tax=Citricoccus sp. NPDC079358 TaxID=3154653 RepID=UPI00344F141E